MSEVRVSSFLKQLEDAKDLPELLERSLRFIVDSFNYSLGLLILFRPLSLQIYHQGTPRLEGEDERIAGLLHRLGEAESFQLLVYEQGIEGLQDMLRRFLPQDPGEAHIFPLAAREDLNGFVVLAGMGDDGGDKENRVLMSVLLRQILMELERQTALDRQRKLSREDNLLLEAGRMITSGLEVKEVLSSIVKASLEIVGVSRCLVGLLDEKGEKLELFYSNVADDPKVQEFFRKLERVDDLLEGGRIVLREGRPLIIEDCLDSPLVNKPMSRILDIRSLLGVPIVVQNRVIGAIQLDEPGCRHRFTPDDIRVMQGIADFAAVAIANARLYRESQEQRERSSELMRRLARVQEEERARISRELHDSMASTLLEIIYRAEALLARGGDEHLRRELQVMLQSSRSTLGELRRIITDLRPSSVEVLGLPRALAALLDRIAATYGLQLERDIQEDLPLDSLLENSLYRLVQEAMSNICRHSGASLVQVSLRTHEDGLLLRISDNGRGFDPSARSPGLGLGFMRERAELLGGSLHLHSYPGRGTTLLLQVPLTRQESSRLDQDEHRQ